VNITVDQPSAASHLTVYPAGGAAPNASNLNVAAGQTVANLAVTGLGTGQQLSIRNNAGNAHVIVDVVGWYG